jgi:L-fuculose-phosphate aldolase
MNREAERDAMRDAMRDAIVDVCHRLYERGLIAGPDGNVSVRLSNGDILITPSGRSKGKVTAESLIVVDISGQVVDGESRPSSEMRMHLRIYQRRDDVNAVVHAHPPTATAFGVAGVPITANVLPEVILQMGTVPLVPYATPGTDALPDSMEPFLKRHDAFLLANHGATTVGPTLEIAHQRMESLEHAARILSVARSLGTVNELSAADVMALRGSKP